MSNDQTKKLTESQEADEDISIRFLESINLRLAGEVTFLRDQIIKLQDMNMQLISKLIGAPKNLSQFTTTEDLEPVRGYQSLNSKIREAEEKAQRDFKESQDADKK